MLGTGVFLGPLALIVTLYNLFSTNETHPDGPIRDLTWGDINFLHTTDTHGWYAGHSNQRNYDGDWGDFISFASKMRQLASKNGKDLLLVDCGDRHDGNGFSDVTTPNGIASMPFFMRQDYDLVTLGNHELYTWNALLMELNMVKPHFGDRYVVSNVEYNDSGNFVPFANQYRYFTTPNNGYRVLAMSFMFDFQRGNPNVRVLPMKFVIEQSSWFQDMLNKHGPNDVDMVIINGHVPVSHDWAELDLLHEHLRDRYPRQVIQYFGGHSHIRDFTIMDQNSTALQSGKYCETVGWSSVRFESSRSALTERFSRSYIDFNRRSFMHHSNSTVAEIFDSKEGLDASHAMTAVRKALDLDKPLGHVTQNYFVDFVPLHHPQSIYRLLTEKILHLLPYTKNEKRNRVIIINTGSIRYDLYKGPYTLDSRYIVTPFENSWAKLALPKEVALRVAPTLNEADFIIHQLSPPHQWGMRQTSVSALGKRRYSKGYVTNDELGSEGDDTIHFPTVQHYVSNVVELRQFLDENEDDIQMVDLVFYEFLVPHILEALHKIKYVPSADPSAYSDTVLGELLTTYVESQS